MSGFARCAGSGQSTEFPDTISATRETGQFNREEYVGNPDRINSGGGIAGKLADDDVAWAIATSLCMGVVECPTCHKTMEPDAGKCYECGSINPYKEMMSCAPQKWN